MTSILISVTFGFIILAILGVPIAFALLMVAVAGIWATLGNFEAAVTVLSQAAFGGLRDFVFIVIPLFTVMGLLLGRCGAAGDLFNVVNRRLHGVPGRLAVATIGGNAIFAAVTGVGLASLIAFAGIAYPEMRRHEYRRDFAMGCIAGSSVLGLLIPPSVIMIVWAILTEQSVGALFIAGIGPGLLLAGLYVIYATLSVRFNSELAPQDHESSNESSVSRTQRRREAMGATGVLTLILLVLGGIYGGIFSPTEAAAFGTLGAYVFALLRGVRWREMIDVVVKAGLATAPIMILILAALVYSRFLALLGVPDLVKSGLGGLGFGENGIFFMMILIWLIMGMFVDSFSILLLTVPIFWPIAQGWEMDPLTFALVGVMVIEAGILSPPFGLGIFAIQAAVRDPEAGLAQAYYGCIPYMVMILIAAAIVFLVPPIATFLPAMML
jgi:tripartite ATP-independent transporter DctM subunit